MKDIEVKKREWVKTAAIVFLAVMLVLTFFSNTIMNRSLPEVAAEYTRSATITARIRGEGTVVANELFEVKIKTKQDYTVNQVHVRADDEVEAGDVLVTLSKASDGVLEEKEKELHETELELEKHLIKKPSYREAQLAIQSARNALTFAQEDRAKAQEELNKAQQERDEIGFDEDAYRRAKADIDEATVTRDRRKAEEEDATRRRKDYENIFGSGIPVTATPSSINKGPNWDDNVYNNLVNAENEAILKHTDAQRRLDRLEYDRNYAELLLGNWDKANEKVKTANNALTQANRDVVSAQQNLDAANANLAAQREVDDPIFDIDTRVLEEKIKELSELVEELKSGGPATEITAAVDGKITQVNVKREDSVNSETILMVIEVPGMGYTASIKATANQSSRVRVGDTAEVDRGWYSTGEPISAVLTSIRPNPEDPQGSRLLVFDVSGDGVTGGAKLNIAIAQQSENYSIVVPGSAIREDSNGHFVLVVETRSSPLRNRYIAARVDVNILATDDTNTAINAAGLTGWDFVITTSSRPIEPGMQVRLVDNP